MSFRRLRRHRGGVIIRRIASSVNDVTLTQSVGVSRDYDSYIRDYYNTLVHSPIHMVKYCYNPNDAHSFFSNGLQYLTDITGLHNTLELGVPCLYLIEVINVRDNPNVTDSVCIYAPWTFGAAMGSTLDSITNILNEMIYSNFTGQGYFNTNWNYSFGVKPITEVNINGWRWNDREFNINILNTLKLNGETREIENDNAQHYTSQWGRLQLHAQSEAYIYFHQQRQIEYLVSDSSGGIPIVCNAPGWITNTSDHEEDYINYTPFE